MKEQRFVYRMKSISIDELRKFLEEISIYFENLLNSSMFFSLFSFEAHRNFESIVDLFASFDRKKSSLSLELNSSMKISNFPRETKVLFHWIRIYSFANIYVYREQSTKERKEKRINNKELP